MNFNVKTFIEHNIELLDAGRYSIFLKRAYFQLTTMNFKELISVLEDLNIPDLTTILCELFMEMLRAYTEDCLKHSNIDSSENTEWSRLSVFFKVCGDFPLDYNILIDYMLKHKLEYGLDNIKQLPGTILKDGICDYDLGWL